MSQKRWSIPIAVTLFVVAVAGTPVLGATGPLVTVSNTSPFGDLDDCGNYPGIFEGTNFLDSEVEPWVAVNPFDPDNIVAFWQQDRWSDGGSRGNVAGVSFDGGSAWQIVPVPGITECSGSTYWERSSDPWVSFGPDGTLHQMSLVFITDPPPGSERGSGGTSECGSPL